MKLGRNLKSLRVAKGLTQGVLAHGLVSVAYVSRIESGQRRPDQRVLAELAQRLGVSIDDLLPATEVDDSSAQHRLTLDYAELNLRTGDAQVALTQVETVIASTQQQAGDATLRRQAHHIKASCLEALGKIDETIIELEDLMEAGPLDVEWIRAGIALSRCHREAGDLSQAIGCGERVLERLTEAGLESTDEAVQLTVTVAAAHFERGDVNFAIRQCQRALKRADQMDSATARAAAYWNASVMESERGNVGAAVPLARRAISALEAGEDARNIARLRSQLGMFQLRMDPPDVTAARENLEAAEEGMRWSAASVVDRARNVVALARADLEDGNLEAATHGARAALDFDGVVSTTVAVEAHVIAGQVAMRMSGPEQALTHYRQAVAVLTSMGADRAAAQLWFDLGNLLETAGNAEGARDAYRRAAASTGLTHRSGQTLRVDGT